MFERERPHPRHSGRCGAYLENAADDNAFGKHVKVVIAPFARWATKRRALQEQVVFVHSRAALISPSLSPPPSAPILVAGHGLAVDQARADLEPVYSFAAERIAR